MTIKYIKKAYLKSDMKTLFNHRNLVRVPEIYMIMTVSIVIYTANWTYLFSLFCSYSFLPIFIVIIGIRNLSSTYDFLLSLAAFCYYWFLHNCLCNNYLLWFCCRLCLNNFVYSSITIFFRNSIPSLRNSYITTIIALRSPVDLLLSLKLLEQYLMSCSPLLGAMTPSQLSSVRDTLNTAPSSV